MPYTRSQVNENASPTPGVIAVAFADSNNGTVQVTLEDPALKTQLLDTPREIGNPDYAAKVAQRDALNAELAVMPSLVPNPDRAALEARAFALAEAQLPSAT